MAATNNNDNVHLLDNVPAEIRNQIWREVVRGDGAVINMSRPEWYKKENKPRLDVTLACKQIYEEAHYMYFAENTFVFRCNNSAKPYCILEPVANWLYTISQVERAAVQKIVVCTELTKPMLEFSWGLAEAINMDSDFVVSERLDKVVEAVQDGKTTTQVTTHFGHDEGHHCNRSHFEMIPKTVDRKRKAAARAAARPAKK